MVLHRTAEGSLIDAVAPRLLPLHKNTYEDGRDSTKIVNVIHG